MSNIKWPDGVEEVSGFGSVTGDNSDLWSSIFGNAIDLLGVGTGIYGTIAQINNSKHLTGSQKEANAWTAEQMALNRAFQSAEAEKARTWQEEQYNQYNSPQAMVRQYSEAGINPALVAGGNMPAASTTTSVPTGNAASSVSPQLFSLSEMLGVVPQLAKLAAEIKNINADTRVKNAEGTGKETENEFKADLLKQNLEQGELNIENTKLAIEAASKNLTLLDDEHELNELQKEIDSATINKVWSEIYNLDADTQKKFFECFNIQANTELTELKKGEVVAQIGLILSQTALADAQKVLTESNTLSVDLDNFEKQWRNQYIHDTGMNPDGNPIGKILQLITTASSGEKTEFSDSDSEGRARRQILEIGLLFLGNKGINIGSKMLPKLIDKIKWLRRKPIGFN